MDLTPLRPASTISNLVECSMRVLEKLPFLIQFLQTSHGAWTLQTSHLIVHDTLFRFLQRGKIKKINSLILQSKFLFWHWSALANIVNKIDFFAVSKYFWSDPLSVQVFLPAAGVKPGRTPEREEEATCALLSFSKPLSTCLG